VAGCRTCLAFARSVRVAQSIAHRAQALYDRGTTTEDLFEDLLRVLSRGKPKLVGDELVQLRKIGLIVVGLARIVQDVFTDAL
jgi:hypothetical protein